MDNRPSYELPVPEDADAVERIEILARDMAQGALDGMWSSQFTDSDISLLVGLSLVGDESEDFDQYINRKWAGNPPSSSLLVSFGLVVRYEDTNQLILTEKAFDLLRQPATTPKVFISYRRVESSAFALYIEQRLRAVGVGGVFIDKEIPGGDEWHARLEAQIGQCRYFISLLGPDTLKSEMVRKEIAWAVKASCSIIPVCHGKYMIDKAQHAPYTIDQAKKACANDPLLLSVFERFNGYDVPGESALNYETAANWVLNSLGYRTN